MLSRPDYEYTNDWFHQTADVAMWDKILSAIKAANILEIGCYEGRATVHLIEACSAMGTARITCVDTWLGGGDLSPKMMTGAEEMFDRNTAKALGKSPHPIIFRKMRKPSVEALAELIAEGGPPFDFVYVDGSHVASDVLTDGVLAFQLLRVGGYMVFDDYVWCRQRDGEQDLLDMPKTGIDMFVTCFLRKLRLVSITGQMIVQKVAA